jgi:cytochrome bd-type quinol oxidase subunit 2
MILRPLPVKTREEMTRDAARDARGVTSAAAFDWALAAFLVALFVGISIRRGINSQQAAAAAVLALVGVPSLLLLVEGLRRAHEVARVLQLSLSSVIVFANAAGVLRDLRDLLQGEVNPSTNLPSLVVGILVVYGLTRRQTIAWFADVSPAEALRHFDRRWLARVALAGTVVGILAVFVNIG